MFYFKAKATSRNQSALHVPPFPKNQGTQYELKITLATEYDEELNKITTQLLKKFNQLD